METSGGNPDYQEELSATIDVVRMLSSSPDPGEEWRWTDEQGSVWVTNSEVCRLKKVKVEHQYYRGLVYVREECLEQAVREDPGSKRRWIVPEERDTSRRVKKSRTGPEMRYGTPEELRESRERLLNKIFDGLIPELSGTRLSEHFEMKESRMERFLLPEPVVDEITLCSKRIDQVRDLYVERQKELRDLIWKSSKLPDANVMLGEKTIFEMYWVSGVEVRNLDESGHLTNSSTVLGRKASGFVESVDKLLEASVGKMKENGSWMDDHAPFREFEVAPDRRNPLKSTTRYREGEILNMEEHGVVSLSDESS